MTDQLSADITGRRQALDGATEQNRSTNAGLWFDRYYLRRSRETDAEIKRSLMVEVAGLEVPEIYRSYYDRWRAALPEGCIYAVAEVRGRLVIGTGDKGVAEAGMTLHHTYGVPFIPGSALKGLAAAYSHLHLEGWAKPDETLLRAPLKDTEDKPGTPLTTHEILFGSTRSAGFVTFFDALYIPGSVGGKRPLAPDVITGHHSDYYVSGTKPPADWDSPIPVPFLTATGCYLIALNGTAGWVDRALTILGMALRDSGIGAKTAAGYGRMRLLSLDNEPIALPAASLSLPTDASLATDTTPGDVDAPTISVAKNPPPSTRNIPKPGAVFAGKVLERDETAIVLEVPGHAPVHVLAVLQVAADTPDWRPGNTARVEVVESEERGGRTILTVRRAPKTKKS